jgi:hypothetical protein
MTMDSNDPQGTASELEDEASQTAAIEALLDDPTEDDANEGNTEDNAEGDEPNGDDAQDDESEDGSDDDAEDGDEADTSDKSDVAITLADGRTLNRKQIEAAVNAETQIRAAFTPKFQQLAADRREFEAEKQATTQQRQYFDQIIPFALQALAQVVGQPATEAEHQADPFAAAAKDRNYQRNIAQLQQLEEAAQYQQQTHQSQGTQHLRQKKIAMRDALFERRTDLKDAAALKRYEDDLDKTLTAYGFGPGDAGKIMDDRILRAFEDAGRYLAIQSNKSKAQVKQKTVPPVAKPGARQGQNNPRAKVRADAKAKLRSSGNPALADALLVDLV